MMYQFKITLRGLSNPEVWRTIAIPGNYTFFKFHKVIQAAFGWENIHFFEFIASGSCGDSHIYMPLEDMADDNISFKDATVETIDNIMAQGINRLEYHYDRNDDWTHDIELITDSTETAKHPVCLGGCGMCPPEGCNGVAGYEHIKFILRERPGSDEARRCKEWLFMEDDDVFNPEYFPEQELNEINEIYERYM